MFYKIDKQTVEVVIEFILDTNTSKFTCRQVNTIINVLQHLPTIEEPKEGDKPKIE